MAVRDITYAEAPNSFRLVHADKPKYTAIDEAAIVTRITKNHLRAVEVCRQARAKRPGVLRVQLIDSHHATVASRSRATCTAHILSIDREGFPTHCALCPGFDSVRYCSHFGAYLLRFLRDTFGEAGAERVLAKAREIRSRDEAQQSRDMGVVEGPPTVKGQWLRDESL